MPEQARYKYRAEVKGIQEWILGSDRLREIKGGSILIDGLTDLAESLAKQVGGTIQVAAAGNVEVHFESAAALERFAQAWPIVVDRQAPGLTVIQSWAPASEGDAVVHQGLGTARNRPSAVLPEVGPLVARSGRTGLPATGKADGSQIDAAIQAKVRVHAQRDRLDDLLPAGARRSFVIDADRLGERYLAVVHADGNNLGARFAHVADKRAASNKVSEACWEAARDAVQFLSDRCPSTPGPNGTELRARPIVVAGDDFTFLVDADHALAFTEAYLLAFEKHCARLDPFVDGQAVTACAGVAIVKTGFPFSAAYHLSESLCKEAKRRLRTAGKSGFLFHRITTASTDLAWPDIEARELSAMPVQSGRADAYLSAGPYTLDEYKLLRELAETMRALPRGSMREWLSLSRDSASRAEALWQRTAEVATRSATSTAHWESFRVALDALVKARFGDDAALHTGWALVSAAAGAPPPPARTPMADALLLRSSVTGTTRTPRRS